MLDYTGFARLWRVSNADDQVAHVLAEDVLSIFRADLIGEALDLERTPITIEDVPADTKIGMIAEDWRDQRLDREAVHVNEDECELTASARAWADMHEGSAPMVLCSTEWDG